MENYEVLSIAGEGSYGIVMKCRQKNAKKVVAIKKLIDIESDHYVRKMAFREIRILKVGDLLKASSLSLKFLVTFSSDLEITARKFGKTTGSVQEEKTILPRLRIFRPDRIG
jgi:serine/threonine protein kinase